MLNLISEYLFQSQGVMSLSELAIKYNLAKSSLHHKVENFRKKISRAYTPVNEEDGVIYIQNISITLDELSN